VRVIANGETYDLPETRTIAEFVRDRGLDPRFVVVERNGEPLERSRYDSVMLEDGDRIELVRAVAGG
jgi:thiamine biosynthesis protein ThiS